MSVLERNLQDRIQQYTLKRRKSRKWLAAVSVLAAAVLLATSYILILPAVTMKSGPYCGLAEHTHASCSEGAGPVCGKPEHIHTTACGAEGTDGNLMSVYKAGPLIAPTPSGTGESAESTGTGITAPVREDADSSVPEAADTQVSTHAAGPEASEADESAAAEPPDPGDWITAKTVYKQTDGQWAAGGQYDNNMPLRIYLSFAVPAGQLIGERNTLTYQLEGLSLREPEEGRIFTGERLETTGGYTVSETGLLTLTFEKDFIEDGGAFGGTLFVQNGVKEELPEQKLNVSLYTDADRKTALPETEASITISGRLPRGAFATAYPVKAEVGGNDAAAAYDITVCRENRTVFEPMEDSPLTVCFRLPQLEGNDGYEVYYVPEGGGAKKRIPASVTEEGLVFEAEHFSVYAVVPAADPAVFGAKAGAGEAIPAPESVSVDRFSPYNRLQITDIDGAAEIVGRGGVRQDRVLTGNQDGNLWGGVWGEAIRGPYGSFKKAYGALAVQFNGSNTRAPRYSTDPDAGWNAADLHLDTTAMRLRVQYKQVGTYDGKAIGAYADIRITPFKNRTEDWNWAKSDYGSKVYYPTIQISRSLYHGWVWQNVKEFHVDLDFHYLNDNGSFGEQVKLNNTGGNYDSPVADYYTIHSLNPAAVQGDGEEPAARYGPEYVLPDDVQDVKAYSAKNPNPPAWESNIGDVYRHQGKPPQYAYNGGTGTWTGDREVNNGWNGVDKPTWLQNSVMIMPQKPTRSLGFTLGNLMRDTPGCVPRTNHVWACFSTDPFKKTSPPPLTDLKVVKKWEAGDNGHPDEIQVEIYCHVKDTPDGPDIKTALYDTITLREADGWTKTLTGLLTRDTEGHYLSYTVKEVPVPGYVSSIETTEAGEASEAYYEQADDMIPGEKYLIVSERGTALRARGDDHSLNRDSYRPLTISDGKISVEGIEDSLLWEAREQNGGVVLKNSYYSSGGYLYNSRSSTLKTDTFSSRVQYTKSSGLQIYRNGWRYVRYNPRGTDSHRYYAPSRAENEKVTLYRCVPGTENVTTVTITNKKQTADLSFVLQKENETGTPLPGAVFDLYQRTAENEENAVRIPGTADGIFGVRIKEGLETGPDGRIKVTGLYAGEHYLVETSPPQGYQPLDKAVGFTLSESGISLIAEEAAARVEGDILIVTNLTGTILPETGGAGIIPYTMAGVLLVLTAGLLYKRNRKREVRLASRS